MFCDIYGAVFLAVVSGYQIQNFFLEVMGCLSSFFEEYFNKLQSAVPHSQIFEQLS